MLQCVRCINCQSRFLEESSDVFHQNVRLTLLYDFYSGGMTVQHEKLGDSVLLPVTSSCNRHQSGKLTMKIIQEPRKSLKRRHDEAVMINGRMKTINKCLRQAKKKNMKR
jgi:hypothetical protein